MNDEIQQLILDELRSIKADLTVVKSNQLTFLQELREMRLENQTKERVVNESIATNEHGLDILNRKLFSLETEIEKLKK